MGEAAIMKNKKMEFVKSDEIMTGGDNKIYETPFEGKSHETHLKFINNIEERLDKLKEEKK